jgi:hypothetical protein
METHALFAQTNKLNLGHGALSRFVHKSNVGTLGLLVEVVGNSSKSNGSGSKKTSKDLGGMARARTAGGLTRSLQRLDQGTSVTVGVVRGSRGELFLTLGRLLVETLTNFKDLIFILLVTVVLLVSVLGLLTRDAVVFDDAGGRVRKSLSVGEFRECVLGRFDGAPFVHEHIQVDSLSIGRALGTDVESHLALVVTINVVAVAASVFLEVIVKSIFVNVHLLTSAGLINVELIGLVVVIVVVLVVVLTVVEASVGITLRLACLVVVGVLAVAVVLCDLTVVLLGIHLGLEVHFNEVYHGDNVVGAVAARFAVGGRAKLEMNKLLLLLALPVVFVVVSALEGKVFVRDGTLLEDEGVVGNPGTNLLVVGIKTTGLRHDFSTELGVGRDVIHGDFDGLAGGDGGGRSREESDGTE